SRREETLPLQVRRPGDDRAAADEDEQDAGSHVPGTLDAAEQRVVERHEGGDLADALDRGGAADRTVHLTTDREVPARPENHRIGRGARDGRELAPVARRERPLDTLR